MSKAWRKKRDKEAMMILQNVIDSVSEHIELNEVVIGKAKQFYMAKPKGSTPRGAWAIACVYAALKTSDCKPITLRDFLDLATINGGYHKTIAKYYRRIMFSTNQHSQICTLQPTIYIERYANQLKLPKRIKGHAMRLSTEIIRRRVHIHGTPAILAAGIIYASCIECKSFCTQAKLGVVSGHTEVAIRNAYLYLVEVCPDLIPRTVLYREHIKKAREAKS